MLPLVEKFVQKGSIVCSDRLRAYRDNLGKMGYKWAGVDHKSGEFIRHDPIYTSTNKKKLLPVSSNTRIFPPPHPGP